MTAPRRIQRTSTPGWPLPEGAVYVGRPSKWGNPIDLSDVGAQYPSLDDTQVATLVVRDFEVLARRGTLSFPNWRHLGGQRGPVTWEYPSVDEIRAELAGKDLACWCALGIADLVDAHWSTGTCREPWGQPYAVHLVLSAMRPLPTPLFCRGMLGLWTPADDLVSAAKAQLAGAR